MNSARDVKLLSFGADEGEEEEPVIIKKKPIVRPDCKPCHANLNWACHSPGCEVITVDPPDVLAASLPPVRKEKHAKSSDASVPIPEPPEKPSKKSKSEEEDITKIREKHAKEKTEQR